MTANPQKQHGREVEAAYQEHDTDIRIRYLRIAIYLSLVCVPAGFFLDLFVYPDLLWDFLALRLATDVVLVGIWALTKLKFKRQHEAAVALGIATALTINTCFCIMVWLSEGAVSPYYAGLNLVLLGISVLLPWSWGETTTVCLVSIAIYTLACLAHGSLLELSNFSLFFNNSFFLIITGVISVTASYFLSRARWQEFCLRHELEKQKQALDEQNSKLDEQNSKLDNQNQELQQLDSLKTQFFSNISHELRTPLTMILGPTEQMLNQHDLLQDGQHEKLLDVHKASLRLLKLINDLLNLTRLEQGVETLHMKPLSLDTSIPGLVDSIRHLARNKAIRIKVDIQTPGLVLDADPAQFDKVMLNLFTNAIKFTPKAGRIDVRWREEDGSILMEIEDNGAGIPEDHLSRIFDRFHQVPQRAQVQSQGVGIGLALVKEIVKQHGGDIVARSEEGRGTVFCLTLPKSDKPAEIFDLSPEGYDEPFEHAFRSADRVFVQEASLDEELPEVGTGDRKILVVDDEADMRRYITSLMAEDYRVLQSNRGGNVATLVKEHSPAIILLDWMLPEKTGNEICKELKGDPENRDLKIILLTARMDDQSKLEALQNGADDFLTKPFSSVELKTRVQNLLESANLQRDLRLRNHELEKTLRKLQETEAMLIQSEKMNAIGTLSAGLLHEVNNPLNFTLTAISYAKMSEDELDEDMKEIIADIEEGMMRIKEIVTNLRTFAYPETKDQISTFPITEAFNAARKIIAKELDDIDLVVNIPEDSVVCGQRTQLTHVFINMLSNASKALQTGFNGDTRRIEISARDENGKLAVSVEDNGPGIPADIRTRVFDPFFTTRDVGEGMGMGLSICHTIIQSHEGNIVVDSEEGKGTRFTFCLPRAEAGAKLC